MVEGVSRGPNVARQARNLLPGDAEPEANLLAACCVVSNATSLSKRIRAEISCIIRRTGVAGVGADRG